jgi:transposase
MIRCRAIDKGNDVDWFREVLADRNYEACIQSKSHREIHIAHEKALYRKRHKIEIMFGKLKDWPIVGKIVHQTVF